jgi:hypothetical protein
MKRQEIEWCEQILMEGTCCDSDGSMCENYPCKFLEVLRRAKNT